MSAFVTYNNLSGKSGVAKYKIDGAAIHIQFESSKTYVYRPDGVGIQNFNMLVKLAEDGEGLGAYIGKNREAYDGWSDMLLMLLNTVCRGSLWSKAMATKKSNYNVTNREDGWAATKWGAGRASCIASTQREAFERARELYIAGGGGEVSVHGLSGRILRKHTYGKKDLYPPPG